jgi:hypothetical protein
VRRVDARPRLKARMGEWYFTYAAMTTFLGRFLVRPPQVEVRVGARTVRGVTAIVQNAEPYTYFNRRPIDIAEGVRLDSGTLAGVVLRRASPLDAPTIAWRAFSTRRRIVHHRRVDDFADVRELTVRSLDARALPLEVDGDYVGDVTEAEYAVTPGGLRVVA